VFDRWEAERPVVTFVPDTEVGKEAP